MGPTQTKAGHPVSHHTNVNRLSSGDTIIHYARGSIRSVWIVSDKPELHPRPSELPTDWGEQRYLLSVKYHDLEAPIALTDVPAGTADAGPFNGIGGVNQGYLFPLSAAFARTLHDTFRDRWPTAWLADQDRRSAWLFQANPSQWNVEVEGSENRCRE